MNHPRAAHSEPFSKPGKKRRGFFQALEHPIGPLLLALSLYPPSFAAASVAPDLKTVYQNVWSLNTGTNYYGTNWTIETASTPFYHGCTRTNYYLTRAGVTNIAVYTNTTGVAVVRAAYGHPVETTVAQYNLGDIIPWPAGVNTNVPPLGFVPVRAGNNPTAFYQSTNPVGAAIYLPSLGRVLAAANGNVEIDWQTATGGLLRTVYTISSVPAMRPARLYWTEPPYNGPIVQLLANGQQVFACIHYNNYVTRPVFGVVTNVNPDGSAAIVTNLVNGVWLEGDGPNQHLRALGVEGMALIEYYADGNFTRSLGVQPFQVQPAAPIILTAGLGQRLLPSDLYYGTTDLVVNIQSGQSDNKVLLYTQPGPKQNWVFAQKATVGEPWDIEIYWSHADWRGVVWPFEVDWYELNWPRDPIDNVLGDTVDDTAPILVPDACGPGARQYQRRSFLVYQRGADRHDADAVRDAGQFRNQCAGRHQQRIQLLPRQSGRGALLESGADGRGDPVHHEPDAQRRRAGVGGLLPV